jgi:hypothetical protein
MESAKDADDAAIAGSRFFPAFAPSVDKQLRDVRSQLVRDFDSTQKSKKSRMQKLTAANTNVQRLMTKYPPIQFTAHLQLVSQQGNVLSDEVYQSPLSMDPFSLKLLLDDPAKLTEFTDRLNTVYAQLGMAGVISMSDIITDQQELTGWLKKKHDETVAVYNYMKTIEVLKTDYDRLVVAAAPQNREQSMMLMQQQVQNCFTGVGGSQPGFGFLQQQQPAQLEATVPMPQLAWSGGAAPPAGDGTIYSDDDGFDEETEADKAFIDGDGDDDADSDYEDDLSARLHSTGI